MPSPLGIRTQKIADKALEHKRLEEERIRLLELVASTAGATQRQWRAELVVLERKLRFYSGRLSPLRNGDQVRSRAEERARSQARVQAAVAAATSAPVLRVDDVAEDDFVDIEDLLGENP